MQQQQQQQQQQQRQLRQKQRQSPFTSASTRSAPGNVGGPFGSNISAFTTHLPRTEGSSLKDTEQEDFIECSDEEAGTIPPIQTIVHRLISLQDFDGFWAFSEKIKSILDQHLQDNTKKERVWNQGYPQDEWITALVIAFLRGKMGAEREVWELVVGKGVEWLAGKGIVDGDDGMMGEARKFFQTIQLSA